MKRLLLVLGLSLTAPVCFAQSASADEEMIKTLCRNEALNFFQRKADDWAANFVHDKDLSNVHISKNEYDSQIGWETFGVELLKYIKKTRPYPLDLKQDNYLIRMGSDMAWIEYNETVTFTALKPNLKQFMRVQNLVVKQNGEWKIAQQINVESDSFKPDPANVEENLDANGHILLGAKKVTEAIEVFKTNVKLFPQSSKVYNSLGEAYAEAGNKELAIQNYEQSIQIYPRNEAIKAALEKLRAK